MKIHFLSACILLSIISFAQPTEPRNLKLGVQIGRSQAHIAEGYTAAGNEGATVPLFNTMLNQFGLYASLGSMHFPKLHYKLQLGYQSLETGYEQANNKMVEGYTMPVFYVKPGVGFSLPIDDRWKIIPSINAAFNGNLDKSQAFEEWEVRYETEGYFFTLNPAIELQMNTDGAWYLSAYVEYQLGFTPVVTSYYPNPAGEGNSKMGVYKGTAMNFGLKLSYCLPCSD